MSAPTKKIPPPSGQPERSSLSSNMRGRLRCAFLALLLPCSQSFAATYDSYGGWLELKGKKTGFFHTEQIKGRWWLVSPDGNAFFSKGVDHVAFAPESDSAPKAPDDPAAWSKTKAEQLRCWGFNTLGAWSAPETYNAGPA
jgi:hypothetical protein